MCKSVNIETWAEKFKAGDFENPSFDTQVKAGWYDWFCRDTSLRNKTRKLGKKMLQLMKSPKINTETSYVWFKNNCPVYGRLYDDFRIADMETGDVIYTIIPSCGHDSSRGEAQVWGRENNFDGPLVVGKWKDVKEFFLSGS
ncbi:MAG: hypothetical protein WCY93_12215 [Anaerolineaceae bacterium]